jgi:hypothetical protein
MSSQTNKDLWQRWAALWNGNLALADEIAVLEHGGLHVPHA